jgi:hypothetical protein
MNPWTSDPVRDDKWLCYLSIQNSITGLQRLRTAMAHKLSTLITCSPDILPAVHDCIDGTIPLHQARLGLRRIHGGDANLDIIIRYFTDIAANHITVRQPSAASFRVKADSLLIDLIVMAGYKLKLPRMSDKLRFDLFSRG